VDVKALADLRYLHLRAGTVPAENLERLRQSAALAEDLVLTLGGRGDRAHVLVVGAGEISPDLEGLLAKANFEPLSSAPDGAEAHLEAEAVALGRRLEGLEAEEAALRRDALPTLRASAAALARAAVFTACEGAMEGRSPVAFLGGWVPRERLGEMERALARDVPSPVALLHEPPQDGEAPPSATALPGVLRPGASLVELYGSPGHDELNPALILAATVPLLFGMMFGDVGYGLLLAAAGVAFRRRLGRWVAPILSCGLASAAFGCLYGSVFGIERWLPPLWLRPMDEPFRLLAAALWVGVGFVLMTFALKAAGLLRQGRPSEAALGFQSGGGAAFYLGAVLICRSLYLGRPLPYTGAALAAVGLLLVAVQAAREVRAHGRAALTGLATEYFHGGLTLITNTLSFLRLAAFALAHAALTMALFSLAEMIPPTAVGWAFRAVLLAVGSLGVLVMDVLAVAVQTIRLEFYEGLARYYRGDGQPHQPLRFTHDEGKAGAP
jgi:V/A-type H+-transporting ATPase subunit I